MMKFKLIRMFGDINRLREILMAFFTGGFAFYVKKTGLSCCISLTCRIKCFFRRYNCPEEDLPLRFRLILQHLGPTFVKIGQILSVRPDFIPTEYTEELVKLQDQVPSFPFHEVEEIIKKEFNKPIDQLFKSFDKEPIAAASLAQVHKAVLKTGQKVAVKVQRPNLRKVIEKDLRIITFIAGLLEKYIPETRNFRPTAAAEEFSNYTLKELDFTIEAKNADRFRYNFKGEKGIKVPEIYWDFTSSKVLTMEFIDGIKMGNHEEMEKFKINHKTLAKNCVKACIEPVLIHGFFHADPHPGNVWVLKDNSVCYLDFGMVGVITRDVKRKMLLHFKALTDQEMDSAIDHLLDLAETKENSDVDGFKKDASEIIISLYIDSTKKETLAKAFYKLVSNGAKYGIVFPSNMILLAKALFTGETMCMMTHPNFDLIKSLTPTIEKIFWQEYGPKRVLKSFKENLPDFLEFLERLPNITKNIMDMLEKKEFDVNVNIKEGMKNVFKK